MKLHFILDYHPEADGQTERMNQTLEQYLRIYCNYQQSDWSRLLPLAEFTINNSPSAITGQSPFFSNKGYYLRFQVQTGLEPISELSKPFLAELDDVHKELKENIAKAQARYQLPIDTKRTPAPNLQVSNLVFVLAKFIRTTRPSKKLLEKYLGPFKIIGRPGSYLYQIKLPIYLRSVHPVFHVSQLELATLSITDGRYNLPPPPVKVDGNTEYEISQVLDYRIDHRRKTPLIYYVQWAGYEGTAEEFSWLGANELTHTAELVQEFHRWYPNKPKATPLTNWNGAGATIYWPPRKSHA